MELERIVRMFRFARPGNLDETTLVGSRGYGKRVLQLGGVFPLRVLSCSVPGE